MMSLTSDIRVRVDAAPPRAWHEMIAGFADGSLYQAWAEPGDHASHLTLEQGRELLAAAEVRLFTVPVVRGGIAYVFWGPMCRRVGAPADPDVFRNAVRALVNEYVERRRMVLRLNPRLFVERDTEYVRILEEEGFRAAANPNVRRSIVLSVTPDPDELRKGFEKKWRNSLSKAERSNLVVESGTGLELFDQFIILYDRMLQRKRFVPTADIQKHRRLQQQLPDALKMRIVLAKHDGQACSGAIYTAVGDTAVYLFGATDEAGMKTSASYLVQWTVIQELKASDVSRYDLNGINPESNPGVYNFKRGLAGKHEPELTFVGQMQAVHGSVTNRSLLLVDKLRFKIRMARERSAAATA